MAVLHYNIHITGKVQGVYYRGSACAEAGRLSLHGFIRNEEDGSVYGEAEGEKDALDRFITWCHRGPAHARVDEVKVTEGSPRGYQGFHVR